MLPMNSKFDVLKEPRGFIKIIQIIVAICAFSTTCDFTTSVRLRIVCSDQVLFENYTFTYPFNVAASTVPRCDELGSRNPLFGDYTGPSQFFVFTGVIVFLYCISATVFYVMRAEDYASYGRISKIDFVLSAIVAALWFIASAAWADGVKNFKFYTQPQRIIDEVKGANRTASVALHHPSYGELNASLIFGFASMAIWACSLWFIWKETSWSKPVESLFEPNNISSADGSSI